MKKVLCVLVLMVCMILTGSSVLAATESQSTELQSSEPQLSGEETKDVVKEYISVDYEGKDFGFKMVYEENAEDWISDIETTCINSYGIEEHNTVTYRHLQFQQEDAFKQYILKNDGVINSYIELGNFKDNISDEYAIYIPIKNAKETTVCVASFSEHEGNWRLGSFGKTEISHPILFDSAQLNELIITLLKNVSLNEAENVENSIKNIRGIKLYDYFTIVVYIETTKEEYLIPLTTVDLLTDLELNKLYTAKEFIEVLKKKTREELPTEDTVEETTTDVMYNGNRNNTKVQRTIDVRIIAVAGICVGVIGIIAVVIIIRKNKLFKE